MIGRPPISTLLPYTTLFRSEILSRPCLRLDQVALPPQLALRRGKVGRGLADVGEGRPDVRGLELDQRRALADVLSGSGVDLPDAARYGREDVRDAKIIEGNAAGRIEMRFNQ